MKTLEILSWQVDGSNIDNMVVQYRVVDSTLNCISGPFTRPYSNWDTSKTLAQTKSEIQSDLETIEGV